MGSSRGMPGNYENNYYPRARLTRVHIQNACSAESKGVGEWNEEG